MLVEGKVLRCSCVSLVLFIDRVLFWKCCFYCRNTVVFEVSALQFFIHFLIIFMFCIEKSSKIQHIPVMTEKRTLRNTWFLKIFRWKSMKKSRKNENHRNSFDKSINNHMNVPDTKKQLIWCHSRDLIREKCSSQLNWPKYLWETDYGWISMIFGQKSYKFMIFQLVHDFTSSQNHEYWTDLDVQRRF